MFNIWLEKAIEIAVKAHKGQRDKAGEPYILHPLHLMMKCKSEDARIVAVLHDVIEDGGKEYREYIKNIGFKEEIIEALDFLTHDKNEDYFEYIKRIKTNSLATEIKLLDLEHNSDLNRLIPNVTVKDLDRSVKYRTAIDILLS